MLGDNYPMTTRDRIKLGCIHFGISQTELAKKVGTSKQEIAHVGSGRYRSGRIVDGLARELRVSVAWLVDGAGTPPSWAGQGAENTDGEPTQEDQIREARTIIRALTQQLEALQLENRQQVERIEALERTRTQTPRRVSEP